MDGEDGSADYENESEEECSGGSNEGEAEPHLDGEAADNISGDGEDAEKKEDDLEIVEQVEGEWEGGDEEEDEEEEDEVEDAESMEDLEEDEEYDDEWDSFTEDENDVEMMGVDAEDTDSNEDPEARLLLTDGSHVAFHNVETSMQHHQ